MKKMKQQFVDSFHELKYLRTIAITAMLIAVAVVLGFYTIQLTEFIRIGFAFLANELGGMLFGPVVGALMGGLIDVVKYLVNPVGPFFPGLTLSAVLTGLVYGMVLYRRPLSIKRIIVANSLVSVFINLLLNTYWMSILYGNAYMALLPARAAKQIIMLPLEVILFYTIGKVFTKAHLFELAGSTAKR